MSISKSSTIAALLFAVLATGLTTSTRLRAQQDSPPTVAGKRTDVGVGISHI